MGLVRPDRIGAVAWLLMVLWPAVVVAQEEQEDKLIFKGSAPERKGKVRAASCKQVSLQLNGIPQPQNFDRDEIADIDFYPGHLPSSYSSGLGSLDRGDPDKAIEYFKSTIQSGGSGTAWVVQFAYYRMAEAYREKNDMAGWEKTLGDLKTKVPDTYFLYDIYRDLAKHHTATGNAAKADATLKEMEAHATEHGHEKWAKAGKLLRAQVDFAVAKYADALKGVRGIPASDPMAGLDAQLLELRILTEMKSFDEARGKARVISEGKGDPRLMAGAFNALGDCERNAGRPKDAMMHYLRGVAEFDVAPSSEHEYSLAMCSIAMAEYAKTSTNADTKATYLERAQRLYGELRASYGASKLSKAAEAALK
jgi:hypothetical protein